MQSILITMNFCPSSWHTDYKKSTNVKGPNLVPFESGQITVV
jgi:hypothetical protein